MGNGISDPLPYNTMTYAGIGSLEKLETEIEMAHG
jgi:hypothetical protein